MKVFTWEEAINGQLKHDKYAATIGVFDGVHLGHALLIKKVVNSGFVPMVITFSNNPKQQKRMNNSYKNLFSIEQKLECLEAMGVLVCVLIDFSDDFSRINGNDFVSILIKSCQVRSFVIGSNFRCGYKLTVDAPAFKEIALRLGATTEIVSPVMQDDDKVSSSRIRKVIMDGRTDLALAMLGHPYALDLRQLEANIKEDSVHSVCTLPLSDSGFVIPSSGTYKAVLCGSGSSMEVEAVISKENILSWPCAGLKSKWSTIAFGNRLFD